MDVCHGRGCDQALVGVDADHVVPLISKSTVVRNAQKVSPLGGAFTDCEAKVDFSYLSDMSPRTTRPERLKIPAGCQVA